MKAKIFILLVALLSLNCHCENEVTENEQILYLLENAQKTLSIGTNTFVLDAYIWRDFMPVRPEERNGIISVNWLVNTKSTPIPDHISMVKQYVIYGSDIWESDYEDESRPAHAYKIERISRNGPEWETGISVRVVSQIYDSKTQKNYYVKSDDVTIIRTE